MALTTQSWEFLDTSGGDNKDTNQNYICIIACTDLGIMLKANLPQEFMIDIGASYEEAIAQAVSSSSIVSELSGKAKMMGVQLVTQALTAQIWQGSTEISFSLPLSFQVNSDEMADLLTPLSQLYTLTLPDETVGGLLKAPGPSLDPSKVASAVGALTSGALNSAMDSVSTNFSDLANRVSGGRVGTALADSSKATAGAPPSSSADGGVKTTLLSAIKNNISLTLGQYMYFESVVITSVGQTHFVQPLENGTMSRVDVTVGFKTFFVPTQKDIQKMFPGMAS